MPSTAPSSPTLSSPSSSAILSPSSNMTLSSDLSAATPQHLYKRSSQYFLTKRFPEASEAIRPLLNSSDRKWQQKAWGLYLIILDNGLKLSNEEGRKLWGRQGWEREVSRVKESKIWDELLDSVRGVKSSIDAEVIVAMIQLSLHHGDTKIAQLRIEEWLAAVPPPFPCQSTVVDMNGLTNGESNGVRHKDYYGKVLEFYCLILLPRNEEWEFANTFLEMNDYLSESRKNTYLTKLADLKVLRAKEKAKPITPPEPPISSKSTKSPPKVHSISKRSSTEDDLLNLPPLPIQTSLPAESSNSSAPTQQTLSTLAHRLLRHPSRYLRQFLSLLQELSQDDSFLRTLLFALALIVALLRRDVRARLKLAMAWVGRKVRETIVMGGKVGYL